MTFFLSESDYKIPMTRNNPLDGAAVKGFLT